MNRCHEEVCPSCIPKALLILQQTQHVLSVKAKLNIKSKNTTWIFVSFPSFIEESKLFNIVSREKPLHSLKAALVFFWKCAECITAHQSCPTQTGMQTEQIKDVLLVTSQSGRQAILGLLMQQILTVSAPALMLQIIMLPITCDRANTNQIKWVLLTCQIDGSSIFSCVFQNIIHNAKE